MTEYSELDAMKAVDEALSQLEEDAVRRVLVWANDKFGGGAPAPAHSGRGSSRALGNGGEGERGGAGDDGTLEFADIAALMEAARPRSGTDQALVGAYWVQVVEGRATFAAKAVNDELKHLGHNLTNISKTLGDLIKRNPALVQQVRKSGTTRQARKQYRLTNAGVRHVRGMIAGTNED